MNQQIMSQVAHKIFSLREEYIITNWRETSSMLKGFRNAGFDFNYRNTEEEYACTIYNSNWVLSITNYTFLHKAVGMSNVDLIRLLYSCAANFNVLTGDGYSPLMIAVCFKQQRVVSCLLKCKAEIDMKSQRPLVKNYMPKYNLCGIPDIPTLITPLMLAIENGDSKIIKILLDNEAEINVETIRHCFRVGQITTASMLLNSLPKDASFKRDEISGLPSLQFFINNYSWTCNDALMNVITGYKMRGYEVCRSSPDGQPVFQSFLRNSFGSKNPTGFDFITKMDDINVNETYLEQPALSFFFSRDTMKDHHPCCNNKKPCCRYYVQWFLREFADFQLYKVQNFVYHQGHLDMLKVLYEAGAIFPRDFRKTSMICPQSCKIHYSYSTELKNKLENELNSFCDMIEKNPVRSLLSQARLAIRKLPNVKDIVSPNSSIGSMYRDLITFKNECDEMEENAFETDFYCCLKYENEANESD